jgi:AcrR family transcriptional regulator
VGRRPGAVDTRGDIVDAAARVFADKGYDGASLRAIAREAGVDPALVHHYFEGKASLFIAAMALPFDPRTVKERAGTGRRADGPDVEAFLTMWDQAEGSGSSFASCLAAMAASPSVADAIREFVAERVWSQLTPPEGEGEAMAERRRALVSSQMMGLAFIRYIMRVPPISTASPKQIAGWVAPTMRRYTDEPLD